MWSMCKCDYEYGGDFKNPLSSGKNPYKLWSLSIIFNTIYVANYLYILFILIANAFWKDFLGSNVLDNCYKDTVKYWLLFHFVKPIITIIIVNCCGLHKLFCCHTCSKACLISFVMLVFDITFGTLAIYYCWIDLFNIYSKGNQYCNITNDNYGILYQNYNYYNYNQSSLIFILLSFLAIHFIFVWLECFRFIEIVTFQHNKQKLKQIKSKKNQKKIIKKDDYESVDMDDLSKSIDIDYNNQLVDMICKEVNDNDINNDQKEEICDIENIYNNNYELNQWIEQLFVYGVNNNDNNNKNNKNENNSEDNAEHSTTLSHFWRATTMVITTGFILQLTADDFCCVCWDEFSIGISVAKLVCGHIIHKKCAIEWFEECPTCPTCRISLTKN